MSEDANHRDFSEDEEAAFVASQSDSDSDADSDSDGEIDLTTGNVVSVESEREKECAARSALLRPSDGSPYEPSGRPLILFDLNGVLVHHKFDGKTHVHTLRPGVQNLLRLKNHGYELGIYSSATERTVKIALSRLERGVGKGETGLFDVMLHREHCALASQVGCMRDGGKPWDTVKPLAKYFGDLRVVLVDDSSHKSYPGEEASMLVLPTWEDAAAESRPGCDVLNQLTDIFVGEPSEEGGGGEQGGDGAGMPSTVAFGEMVARARASDAFRKAVQTSENAEVIDLRDILESDLDNGEIELDIDNDDEDGLLRVFDDRGGGGGAASAPGPGPSSRALAGGTNDPDEDRDDLGDQGDRFDAEEDAKRKKQKTAHPPRSPVFSTLHHEMERFLDAASPTDFELLRVEHLMGVINQCTKELWPRGNALLFGSQAQGLALPGADLDVTITGVLRFEKARANTGYAPWQKSEIKTLLEQLLGKLMEAGIVDERAEIILARIPVLKFNAVLPAGGEKLPVDISLGTSNGITAMQFLRANVIEMAPLRPIVLFIKCVLREANLSEVFTGGLGSYALINLVMARLMHWGYKPVEMGRACAKLNAFWKDRTGEHGSHFSMSTEDSALSVGFVKRLRDFNADLIREKEIDLGVLLWDFLVFFGTTFDYASDAVSVLNGGVRRKGKLFDHKTPLHLVVEDPQEPGKDISKGTFDIKLVQSRFQELERQLAAHCELKSGTNPRCTNNEDSSHCILGADSILGGAIDVALAVDRGDAGIRARKRQDDLKTQKQVRMFGPSTNSTVYKVGSGSRSGFARRQLRPSKAGGFVDRPSVTVKPMTSSLSVPASSKSSHAGPNVSLGVAQKTQTKATPATKQPKKEKVRFYAVVRGRKTGIFQDVAAAEASTTKFPGARSRSFKSLQDAEAYLTNETPNANLTLHKKTTEGGKGGKGGKGPAGGKPSPSPRGKLRGSKKSRAVEAQWSNRRGRHEMND